MPSRLRGQVGWFLLIGVAGVARAAEGLPLLLVDPALLGPAPASKTPPQAAAPTPAAAVPVPSPAATAPAAVPKAAPSAPPVGMERPRPIPMATARAAAAPAAEPAAAVAPAAGTEPAPASRPTLSEPPQVAERPAVAPTYSALVAAGELPAPRLRPSKAIVPVAKDDKDPRPTFVRADRIGGRNDVETVAEGDVELRRGGKTLTADKLTYLHAEDEVDAVGNVRLTNDEDVMTGPHLHMRVEDNVGYFDQPSYSITRLPSEPPPSSPGARQPEPRAAVTGSGEAERLDFKGEGLYGFVKANYSTCSPGSRDWYVEAKDMELDYNREVGEAHDARLVFEGQPLLYTPWLNFSLNNQRKTGLLAPTIGHTSNGGFDVEVPWYWNIAPNMDATITERELSKRGLQSIADVRYLNYNYQGQTHVEWLPTDRETQTRRYAYTVVHNQNFGQGLTGSLNLSGASDGTYFTDLASRLSVVSQTNLLRQGLLTYGQDWWSTALLAQRYQTLQDPNAPPVAVPYYRLPQWTVTATRPDLPGGLVAGFSSEFVNFSHPTDVVGKRTTLYPQISLPLQTAAFYVTPKFGVKSVRYTGLERQASGLPSDMSVSVPIFSVDTGLVFERDVNWFGHAFTQTLEPRLYYLNVPNRDQSQFHVFDTGLADFNFAQIFSENRYGGGDRIADANQLTGVVTSRLVDPETGAEIMRGAIGGIAYFSEQHVVLPGETPRTNRRSDLLATFTGQVMPRTFLDTGLEVSSSDLVQRFNIATRYQPETTKVLNAGYRYTRDLLGQIDVSGQWPLGQGWYAVGRYNYSTRDKQMLETVAGVEYNAGCWVARFVLQRLTVLTGQVNTGFYVQLELNGLTSIGSDPLQLLKREVPGYNAVNRPAANPNFWAY
jgi:LPS-assembly protein